MPKFVSAVILIGLVACFGASRGQASSSFPLHDGDRVVFYGDSITQDGAYGLLVEEYVRTRFPQWDIRFYNAGVGGDRVDGGGQGDIATRLARDVVSLHPTVVTIMLGMNDGSYRRFDPAIEEHFSKGYSSIVAELQKQLPGVRLYLILPSPFDDVSRPPQFEPGYDSTLRKLGESVAAIARENHLETIDFGEPLNSGIASVFKSNPELARTLLPDRVHPSPAGHLVLGAALLRAWHAPSVVSRVEIDMAAKSAGVSENSTVSAIAAGEGKWSWEELDTALPLPINYQDETVILAEEAGAGLELLGTESLRVTGLAEGSYALGIDGKEVGTFTKTDLEKGIDLARFDTPMRGQAFWVLWGAASSHQDQLVRREMMAYSPKTTDVTVATDSLAAFDEANQARRSRSAIPKPHTFSLTLLR